MHDDTQVHRDICCRRRRFVSLFSQKAVLYIDCGGAPSPYRQPHSPCNTAVLHQEQFVAGGCNRILVLEQIFTTALLDPIIIPNEYRATRANRVTHKPTDRTYRQREAERQAPRELHLQPGLVAPFSRKTSRNSPLNSATHTSADC